MSIQVVDLHEIDNDGAYGMFIATVEDSGDYFPVTIWYSLADNRAIIASKALTPAQILELEHDPELLGDLREALHAERDSRSEETKAAEVKEKLAREREAKIINTIKWKQN